MSRVYVLEDDPERIVALCRYFDRREQTQSEEAGKARLIEVQWNQTAQRADEFNPPYDIILLDHDLGGRQRTEDIDNGMTFLQSILRDNLIGAALVIIHSFNAPAATRMKQAYPPAIIAPFNTIEFWTLLNAALR